MTQSGTDYASGNTGGGVTEAEMNAALAQKADDSAVVHDTGNETVAGVKTFSSSPVVPTPTTNFQAATKKYVDDNIGGGGDGFPTLAADYANDLDAAVTTIGATATLLVLDEDTTITTDIVVPATLTLMMTQGAKIIEDGGSLEFEGIGLADPESQIPCFSGFTIFHDLMTNVNYQNPATAKIHWTGDIYPKRLSANLWDNAEAYERAMCAIEAMSGNVATIVLYPDDYAHKFYLREGLSLHFREGNHTSSILDYHVSNDNALVIMEGNNVVYGDGQGKTIITESADGVRFFYVSGMEIPSNAFGNTDIHVRDITFQGNPSAGFDSSSSAVYLGNCSRGSVKFCDFLETHGFAAYVGGFQNQTGITDQANGCWITDNYMRGLGTQYVGTVGGMNVYIERNHFIVNNPTNAVSAAIVDIEPNANTWGSENLFIRGNILDGRLSQLSWNGITVQRAHSGVVRNVVIEDNLILNTAGSVNTFRGNVDVDTGDDTITIHNHGFQTGQVISLNGGSITYKWVIAVDQETIKLADSYALAVAGTNIDLTSYATADTYYVTDIGQMANGIQIFAVENAIVQNNTIKGGGQRGIDMIGNYKAVVKNNTLIACSAGMLIDGCAACLIEGNRYIKLPNITLTQGSNVTETNFSFPVDTTSGSDLVFVTLIESAIPKWWIGYTVTIGGTDYVIYAVHSDDFGRWLKLSANLPSTASDVTATFKFSSNTYRDNDFDIYNLVGDSKILSDARRNINGTVTLAQITANQNDYNPQTLAYLWNLSSDASRDITGIGLDQSPYNYTVVDGQTHLLVNSGSNDIVLKHQDTNSTAAYRFKNSTGADITLTAGQAAEVIYSTALSRWLVFKKT